MLTNIQDAVTLVENGQISVGGLDVLLFYDEEFDPNRLQIRVDLQELPVLGKSAEALLTALMIGNYSFGMGGLFVFGINPLDGHVVLTIQQEIDNETTGRSLLDALQKTVMQAKSQWQQVCADSAKMDRKHSSKRFSKV